MPNLLQLFEQLLPILEFKWIRGGERATKHGMLNAVYDNTENEIHNTEMQIMKLWNSLLAYDRDVKWVLHF